MHPDTRKLMLTERDLQSAEAKIRSMQVEIDRLKAELALFDTTSVVSPV